MDEPLGLVATLRADLAANRYNTKGKFVVCAFRVASWTRRTGRPPLWAVPVLVAYQLVVEWVMGIELPARLEVGPGLAVWHGTGLVVHANARLGAEVTLRHNTTIGALDPSPDAAAPRLGDRVEVGVGAIILGDIEIGDGARIGAGSVVLRDVPAGATVVGNPATVVA